MRGFSVNPTTTSALPASSSVRPMLSHWSMQPWSSYGRWLLILLLTALSVLQVAPLAAQADEPTFTVRRPFGTGDDVTNSVAVGDVNGDGYLDLVAGNGGGQSYVYLNDGQGNFPVQSRRPFGTDSEDIMSVAIGDVNGDGYFDLVAGNDPESVGAQSYVYLNDGQGNFPENARRPFGSATDHTRSLAIGDLNGDGYLDLVAGNGSDPQFENLAHLSYIYLNDGQGNFPLEGRRSFSPNNKNVTSVAVVDVDGDDQLDLVVGVWGNQSYVYLNEGQGDFSADYRHSFGTGADNTYSLAVGDMDGDGHLDLIAGNLGGQSVVYLNDGQGNFPQEKRRPFGTDVDNTASVAVGDMDGDGHLDLVVGNQAEQNYVYLNDGQGNFPYEQRRPFGTGHDNSVSVAIGDLNNDGHLDVANSDQGASLTVGGQNMVYLNDGGGNFSISRAFGPSNLEPNSVAVADVNSDGYLDLVVGHYLKQDYVYLNDREGNFPQELSRPFGTDPSATNRLAVGDLNNDGYLDLVVGHRLEQDYVYLNDGEGNFPQELSRPVGTGSGVTTGLAVGDLNNDGYLDLAVGDIGYFDDQGYFHNGQNLVYLNDGQGNFPQTNSRPFGTGDAGTVAVAIGDVDGDGDLDLIVGNAGAGMIKYLGQNYIYLNDGRGNFSQQTGRPFGPSNNATTSVAAGDMNGDGAVDIVVGTSLQQNLVYLNDGQGNFSQQYGRPFGTGGDYTSSLATGDINSDGFLDIVQGNYQGVGYIYLNDGQGNFPPAKGRSVGGSNLNCIAVGDVDSNGVLDLITGSNAQQVIYLNTLHHAGGLVNHSPQIAVTRPGPTANAAFFSTPVVLDSPTIPITYTLFDQEDDRVGRVEASYSLDGGGKWLPAIAVSTTVTTHLSAAPTGVQHVYTWDTSASGFFGQSDNVVVRLVAYSQPPTTTQPITGSYRYTNSVPGATQWATVSATTFPFRVRGTQVRVVDQEHDPVAGALVYRLSTGQFFGAKPMADATGQPFRTDAQGYLGGRGALQRGDSLVALLPVTPTHPLTFTQQYSYFLTSAEPISSGLALTQLSTPGVLTLTVPTASTTNTHPLMLFNLTVSLEWDASDDDLFQAELENGFKRASEILFKVTNGQAAIGRVDVWPAKNFWNRTDLVLYASNSLRPSAAIGGVVNEPMGEIVRPAFDQPASRPIAQAYLPGQIRMGVSWDPFGEESGDLSEQWWRALAHELSHHLLFLPDDYVGFKTDPHTNQRVMGRVDCQGSFMTTTFDPSYTRFLDRPAWQGDCLQTLAAFTTGRSDWETITHFYPMLKSPLASISQAGDWQLTEGPNLLPLDVTHLAFWPLSQPRPTVPARYFQFRNANGEIVRLPTAQVYLFQTQNTDDPTDDILIALGSPTGGGDRIKVRGGKPGDRLCLFDFGASDGQTYTGCIRALSAANVSIPVRALGSVANKARWAPAIDISALTTRTLLVTVTQTLPSNTRLKMQVFPAHYPSAPGVAPVAGLTLTHNVYVGQIALPYPASDVSIRVWVDGGRDLEAVSQFSLQLPWKPDDPVMAGPNTMPMGGPNTMPMGGPNTMPMGGTDHPVVGSAPNYRFAAPAFSADAQVVIYNVAGVFEPNGIERLQILRSPPEVGDESWLVPVGQAYFVQSDPTLAAKRAIAITYLQRDVPEGYEHTLTIYYLRQGGKSWQRLATQQFVENLLVADLQVSAGTYAVMSTVVLPALSSGLNLVTYPLPDTRPITTALASLAGQYSNLYEVGPNGKLLLAPQQLVFGHTYAIQIESRESVYLYLAPPRRLPNGQIPGQ